MKKFTIQMDEGVYSELERLAQEDMRVPSTEAAWLLINAIKARTSGEVDQVIHGAIMDLAGAIQAAKGLKDVEAKIDGILVEAGIRRPAESK